MAKRKRKQIIVEEELVIPKYEPPRFYLYYNNKTGEILSVTNEKSDKYEYGLELEFSEVEKFLTGEHRFIDYVVGYHRVSDNLTRLSVVPKDNEEYSFRHNVFEWIKKSDNPSELVVEWNKIYQSWVFKLDKNISNKYENLLTPRLVFFVTLEDDFDFLVRTIHLSMDQLITDDIVIPFETSLETKIDKISISSKLIFNSYSLKVADE